MRSPLRRSHVLLAVAGALGLAAFLLLYKRAFPQASVPMRVSRQEARERALAFLEERGAALNGYREASAYQGSNLVLVFLQRTLGLEQASRWARDEVPVWTWSFRWFRPLQKEEWQVQVGMDGRVVEYRHLVDEAAAGADLPQDSALALAETLVRARGWDLAAWERVEASSQKRENRTDHRFTWERRGSTIPWREDDPEAGTGAVRLSVAVQGAEVGEYRHFLKVPEEFRRELEKTTSVGLVLTVAALVFTALLALVALGLAIARSRRDEVRWRPAITLAGVVAGLLLVQQATAWPLLEFGYETSLQWPAYVGIAVGGVLLLALLYAMFVVFTAGAGECLGRETFPQSLSGFLDALRGRLRTPALARASLYGYAVGFLFLGYLTAFYVLAERHLGAWLPASGPHSEIFNLYLPFLTPLTISLVAAISEEVTYRLFGIALVKRYLKSTVLALLIPAMIWAFAHSTYPVFPVYLRGIELTLGGILLGVVFLRLGLLACIAAHYLVDAVLVGLPLLTSGHAAYVIPGIVVMAFALLPAGLALTVRRRPQGTA